MTKEMPSPETWTNENLKIQTKRVVSDAELIRKDAKYTIDKGSDKPRLDLSDNAMDSVNETKRESDLVEKIKNLELKEGDSITIERYVPGVKNATIKEEYVYSNFDGFNIHFINDKYTPGNHCNLKMLVDIYKNDEKK